MISVIICSRKSVIDPNLAENINDSIGVAHEIIAIDNSHGQYNIFQAYNKGVDLAKGDVFCFMHDDTSFRTKGWGKTVEQLFSDNKLLGVLGVAGGHFLPNLPCSWSTCDTRSFLTFQSYPDGRCIECSDRSHARGKNLVEVASVDGLWMCARGDLFLSGKIRFDDKTFNGFHCYDSDLCMQIQAVGYQVMMTYDVEVIHNSTGSHNASFFESIELWHNKWRHCLPILRGLDLTEHEQEIHQKYAKQLMEYFKEDFLLYQRLHSPEYRLGHFLLKPYRFFKRISK